MRDTVAKYLSLLLTLTSQLCVLCLFSAQAATTDDPSLAELKALSIEELLDIPLVYGASRHVQKITEAPSSISIVTADDIRKNGHRTLADILRSVQGFYISADRGYGFIGVRGFNRPGDFGGRVLVLVDGHRINDPLFDSAPVLDDFILDVDLIDRVEVIRGPSFSLYGANAFFGGINVITRQGHDLNGVEIAGRAASFNSFRSRLSYGKRFDNGLEMLISGSTYDSDGPDKLYYKEFDKPETNNGIAQGLDGTNAQRIFGSLGYKDFKLRTGFVSRDKSLPTAPFAEAGTGFNVSGTNYLDQRYFIDLVYSHEFESGLDLKGKLYYDWYNFEGDYVGKVQPDGFQLHVKNPSLAEWMGVELQVAKQLFDNHRVMLGVEHKNVLRSDQESLEVATQTSLADVHTSWQSFSLYLQDEWAVAHNLILNAGLRYDNYSFFGDTANPRLALIYNPWKKTTLKFLYGEAFRAPNDYERVFSNTASKANPNLKPETIRTFELIWDQYINNNLRFNVSAYHNQVNDLISQVKVREGNQEFLIYENVNNATTWGTDFEVEAKTDSDWRAQLSYSWQHTEDQDTGGVLTNSPEHLIKLNLTAPLYTDKLYAAMQVQYSSSVQTLGGNTADGYWITNLNLFSQKLMPGLDLSAGVFNLFNERYGFPGRSENRQDIIQQDGRTFQFVLRKRF